MFIVRGLQATDAAYSPLLLIDTASASRCHSDAIDRQSAASNRCFRSFAERHSMLMLAISSRSRSNE